MSDYLGQRLHLFLRKADYQREFDSLLRAIEESSDPASSALELLDLNYDPEEGGLPNGSIKFVVGLGLFYLDTNSVAIVDGITVLATGLPVGRWIKYSTGGGGGGSVIEETVPFDYTTVGNGVLTLLNPGDLISDVRVSITTPFSGGVGTPQVRVGTSTVPNQFFDFSDTRLTAVGDFEVNPIYISPFMDQLTTLHSPNGATAGAGVIYYRIRRI